MKSDSKASEQLVRQELFNLIILLCPLRIRRNRAIKRYTL